MADPAWLKSLKKEAKEKGLDFKDLLVKYMPKPKGTDKRKTPVRKAAKGGMMKKKGYAKGGMTKKKKGYAKGGMMKKKGYAAGGLKKTKPTQKGLKKLPSGVRNKMGYMAKGGMTKKKKGYAKGGVARKKK